jgi:hypothetical protein
MEGLALKNVIPRWQESWWADDRDCEAHEHHMTAMTPHNGS